MRILIVEDELHLNLALKEIFEQNKYIVDSIYDGIEGYEFAQTKAYDAIILDVNLPNMDGITMLNKLRKEKNKTPILILSAKSEINDKIIGLDNGADDYLTKPFNTEELLARVRVLTRRHTNTPKNTLDYLNLSLNLETCELKVENNTIKLGLKEFYIMELLLKNPKQVITKETFIKKVWGFDTDVEYNNVEVYISFLRKKLNFLNSQVQIKTTRGLGYALGNIHD